MKRCILMVTRVSPSPMASAAGRARGVEAEVRDVEAGAAEIGVDPAPADEPVVAGVAEEAIVAVAPLHVVVTASGPDRVVAGEAEDVVVIGRAVQAIIARRSRNIKGHVSSLSCCCGAPRGPPIRPSCRPRLNAVRTRRGAGLPALTPPSARRAAIRPDSRLASCQDGKATLR